MNFLDILIVCLLAYAAWKGFKKGFIIELFTFLALFIGLYAGIHFSDFVSEFLMEKMNLSPSSYLPIISFAIVFLAIGAMIYFGGKALEKLIKTLQLGLINRILGAAIYACLICLVFSTFYWLLNQVHLISPEMNTYAKSISILAPLAPKLFEWIQQCIPFLGHILDDLLHFFDRLNAQLPTYVGIDR